MTQILAHLVGDFLLQSDWMARNKARSTAVAAIHAAVYGLPFLLLDPSPMGIAVIVVTHFFIDRFRLARFVVFSKNLLAPASARVPWRGCCALTGSPAHLSQPLGNTLFGIADATMHLAINYAALRWL